MSGKTKRLFSKINFAALLGFAFVFLSVPSCEVGLGAAVDTQVPTLSILQPSNDTAPIRGAFVLKGTCDDDGTIARIEVAVQGLDSEKNDTVSKTYIYKNTEGGGSNTVTLSDTKEWECRISPAADGLVDGSYEITVTIADTYEHKTTDKVAIKIDNTPPILVLTRPSTIFDAVSPDTYGQEFSLEGQSADDSDVGKVEVKIYSDPNCEESSYKDTITLSKVPPTVSQTVMQWAAEDGAYKKLYGEEMTAGTKKFYCKLVVYDDARPCPDEGEGAGKGNSAGYYYLYNDIYDDVLSEFKLTQVYSILNGTYTSSESNRTAEIISKVNQVKEILGDGAKSKRTTRGSFALNPMNNPKFSVSGYDPLVKYENQLGEPYNIDEILLLSGSDITVQVSSGLDKIPLDDDTIGIYAVQVDKALKPVTDESGNPLPKITLFEPACDVTKDENGNRIKLIKDEDKLAARTALIKTVGSYDRTISITLNKDLGFALGKYYVIEVVGCDKNDNKFFNNKDNYGFTIISEGAAPDLTIDKPETGLNYIGKNTEKLVITGRTTHTEGNPKLTISNGTVTILDEKEIEAENGSFEETFEVADLIDIDNIDNSKLKKGDNTLTIVSSYEGRKTTVQRTVIYDAEDPEINVTSVSPVVESFGEHVNCVNGEIKIKGTLFDNYGIDSASYEVKTKCTVGDDEKDVIIASGDLDKSKTSFTITANTTKGTIENTEYTVDNCDLTVEITATDVAGNETKFELKTSESKSYYICQESDRPTIKPTNFEVGKENGQIGIVDGESVNLFGTTSNNTLNATIEDDDGIEKVTVKYKLNGFSATGDDGVITKTFTPIGTPTTYSLKHALVGTDSKPLADGKYEVKIEIEDLNVEDTNTLSSSEITTWIGVSAGAPTVTINSPASNQWYAATGDNSISPTFTLTSNTLNSVVRKIEKVITSAAGTTYTEVSAETNIATTATSDTIALTSVHTGDGNSGEAITGNTYRVTYTATDMFGQTGTASFTYRIDNTPPVTTSAKLTTSKGDLGASVWFNTTTIGLTGTDYSDGTSGSCSGLESFDYWITESNVSDISETEKTGNVPASGTGFKTSIDVLAGQKKIWIQAIDNVGNRADVQSCLLNIDTTDPTMSLVSIDNDTTKPSSKLVNGTSDVKFVVSAADEGGSNVASVKFAEKELTAPNAKSVSTLENDDVYEFTILKESLASGPVKVTVTDNAGNKTTDTMFSIELDNTAPKVAFTSHGANATVNKTITLTGTVTDDQKLDYITLEYSTDGTNYTKIGDTSNTTSYPLTLDGSAWSKEIDTTTYNNAGKDKTVKFRLTAYDKAGNSKAETLSLIVNQNSDRPVITISGINPDGSTLAMDSKIYGSVSDDDGAVKGLWYYEGGTKPEANPTLENDGAWTKITVTNNSWNISVSTAAQGEKTLWFYCIDGIGTGFAQKSGVDGLYFNHSDYSYSGTQPDDTKLENTTGVKFSLDTISPAIGEFKLAKSSTGTAFASYVWNSAEWTDKNNESFGGSTPYLYGKVKVTEATGMDSSKPISISFGTSVAINDVSTDAEKAAGNYTYIFGPINVSEKSGESFVYPSETTSVTVTAHDGAGRTGTSTKTIIVDNEAPTVTMTYPSASDIITNSISINGIYQDNAGGSGVNEIYWAIPTTTQASNPSTITWTNLNSTSSWKIDMTGKDNSVTNYLGHYANDTYATVMSDSVWKIPLYFKTSDKLGNEKVYTENYVVFDTDAGRPYTEIIYPANGATVGGTVTISGSATDDNEVTEVHLQVDVNGDGNFDSSDYGLLYNDGKYGIVDSGYLKGNSSSWYLLATGTNSWKLPVKTKDLNITGNSDKKINIRAQAYDNNNTTRDWVSITVVVDKNAPIISDLKLVQKKNGGIISEREYTAGMYISNSDNNATWYLQGKANDDTKISSVAVTNNSGTIELEYDSKNDSGFTAGAEINFEIPISISSDGKIYSTLQADDDNNTHATISVEVNVDSTPPSMYKVSGSSASLETKDIGSSLRITSSSENVDANHPIQNSNVVYTFGDTVKEEGSGLDYIAFYFKRTGSGVTRVYDSMTPYGTKTDGVYANQTNINASITTGTNDGDAYINTDGLAVKYVKTDTRDDTSKITSASLKNSTAIRKGGLIKISGTYSLITAFESSSGTITFSPAADTSYTTAEVVLAQVVDHQITEGASDNTYTEVLNDDGDGMVEAIKKSGFNYEWEASIFSNKIPDGPIELHVVAIDKAGNLNHGYLTTSIQNNRPRIAKVLLGTDLNYDGKVTYSADEAPTKDTADGIAYGEFNFYKTLGTTEKEKTGKSVATLATIEDGKCKFTVKNNLVVLPEFVGGNGDIKYLYQVSASASASAQTGTPAALTADLSSVVAGTTHNISNTSLDKGAVVLEKTALASHESSTNSDVKYFAFTFWDSTEELTSGTDTQWALLNIPVIVDVVDNTAPAATIKPFYWEGKGDGKNSIQWDADENALGHIELEGDWKKASGYKSSESSGVYDGDPKVSGKIKIEGTAYDESRLTKITINANGSELATATYSGGNWSCSAGLIITDGGISQAGHSITWTYLYNTPDAQEDLKITVVATDGGDNNSTPGETQTTTAKNTGYYQMDVVPYISGIERTGTDVLRTNRGRSGAVQVVIGEEIEIKGFNLLGTKENAVFLRNTANKALFATGSNTATMTATSGSSTSMKVKVPGNSGYLQVVANGVYSINNAVAAAYADKPAYDKEESENKEDLWTCERYLNVWKNDEYFLNSDDPISPAMDKVKYNDTSSLHRLYGGWGSQGSKTYGSYAGSSPTVATAPAGNSSGQSNYFGDPISYYDVVTDGTDTYHVIVDCWQGSTTGWGESFNINKNGYCRLNGFNTSATSSSSGNLAQVIERMGKPGLSPDNADHSDGTDEIFNQFLNPRLAYYKNNIAYLTYYDRYAKCLKWASVTLNDNKIGVTTKYATEGIWIESSYNVAESGTLKNNICPIYENGKMVVAGYDTLQATPTTNLDVGLWSAIAVDKTKGYPVVAYYDSTNRQLWLATAASETAYPVNSNNPIYTATATAPTSGANVQGNGWKRTQITVPGKTLRLGQYVSLVTDNGGNLHIACYDGKDGDLYYFYGARTSYGEYTFTSCLVDGNGTVGTWTDIKLTDETKSGYAAGPVISYIDNTNIKSEDGLKVAYMTSTGLGKTAGTALAQADWETATAPCKSSVEDNRVTLAVGVTDSENLTATSDNSKLAAAYVSSRFECVYLRNE